jgi:branched-chain amino acid transport system substrate-binding protein
MTVRRVPLATTTLLSACLIVSACARDEPYVVGVVMGGEGTHGASLAAADVNARGGIGGHRLELRMLTEAYGPRASVALAAAESLVSDDRVLAVVGHANSSASLAASQIYDARHVVQIAPTSSTPLYSQAGPYSFRLVASDEHQGDFLAAQVLAIQPAPRVAVLYVNDDYGRALRDVVVGQLGAAQLAPVYDGAFSEDTAIRDDVQIVAALARPRPQLLLWLGRSARFRRMAPLLRRALPTLSVVASDGFGAAGLATDPGHVFDGVRYVQIVDFAHPTQRIAALQSRFAADGWPALEDQAVLSYDAVLLLAAAMAEAGPRREAIRDWLAEVGLTRPPFVGASGPISFDANGDREPSYHLVEVGVPAPAGAGTPPTVPPGGG